MARRQLSIAGTERPTIEEIDTATDELCKARSERKRESKRLKDLETQKEIELVTLLKSHKVPLYKFFDDEGEEVEVELEQVWKVNIRKTGEAESEIGSGIPEASGDGAPGIHPGLIAQAEKAQADSGNTETTDGDVVPSETAAPKKKRASKSKAKGKKRR